MFGSKKSITDRVKESLTDYLDDKFEDYRGQIALDLARGLGSLAGLVAIWSLAIIATMFFSISVALLLGWVFSFYLDNFAYPLSFLLVSIVLIALATYIIKHQEKYIVTPVFELMAKTLRTTLGVDEEPEKTVKNKNPHPDEDIETPPMNDKTKAPLPLVDPNPDLEIPPVKTETPPAPLKKGEL
jgi:hypothetical protein